MEKKCNKCGRIKDLDLFYKHSGMADGRLNKCKECTKFDTRKNRDENRDYYLAYDRKRSMLDHRVQARKEYSNTDRGKEVQLKSNRRYRERNEIKYKAHSQVATAIKNGTLVNPRVCEECLTDNHVIHGHHDDYKKPLDVRWLCASCHTKWHDENGEGLT